MEFPTLAVLWQRTAQRYRAERDALRAQLANRDKRLAEVEDALINLKNIVPVCYHHDINDVLKMGWPTGVVEKE
jgi:hypothetical protein